MIEYLYSNVSFADGWLRKHIPMTGCQNWEIIKDELEDPNNFKNSTIKINL